MDKTLGEKNMEELQAKLGLTQEEFYHLLEKAFTALDGLWFLGVEEEFGFDGALKVDIEVWRRFGQVLIRRMKKMWNHQQLSREQILRYLDILYVFGHLKVDKVIVEGNSYTYIVEQCPWWDNLKRAGREKLIPCHVVDIEMFRAWLEVLDPEARVEFQASLPQGQDKCVWRITFKS
jgi:hypothetical protein